VEAGSIDMLKLLEQIDDEDEESENDALPASEEGV
jgi:hypothetical protein